jgi:hypothetical protein
MPTKRRRRGRGRREWLTDEQRMELAQGERGAFGSEDEARAAWFATRDDFMGTNPGTRPAGWWRFEAPVPRPMHVHTGRALYEAGVMDDVERAACESWWRRIEDQAFEHAESAREYHRACRDVPLALRREWPGQTARDVAAGEQRDVDPRIYLSRSLA